MRAEGGQAVFEEPVREIQVRWTEVSEAQAEQGVEDQKKGEGIPERYKGSAPEGSIGGRELPHGPRGASGPDRLRHSPAGPRSLRYRRAGRRGSRGWPWRLRRQRCARPRRP